LDPSQINLRAVGVVALGVVTAIVLLAVVPKDAPNRGVRAGVAAGAVNTPSVASTLPAGSTTTPGSTTTTFPIAGRPVLRLGSTGPDVVALQQRLTALGYNTGTTNGSFAAGTQTAVMNFQKAKNLQADGVVGPTTWAALGTG
jgi:peptidoglycan hydrolase-like protein with peptidoglycan-binding domain